jgi:integrase
MITPGVYLPRRAVTRRVETYIPHRGGPTWQRVATAVRDLVLRADPLVPYSAAELMSVVGRLAMFCDGHGIADAQAWLEPTTIDWFLDVGCASLSTHTRSTYRARLRRLVEAVRGVDGAKPIPLSASPTDRPYTAHDQAGLWSWANGQPTEALRTGCRLLLALGLGCGLSTDEVIDLRAGEVRIAGNGAVVVEIAGRRSRLVICQARWEQVLSEHAQAAGSRFLFRPNAVRAKNVVSNFLARAHRGLATPPVKISRLRDTWMVEHLAAGTPLSVLVAAAGLDGLSSLDRLLPYLPAVGAERAERLLRDRA